jgi:hypothetical protein
VRYSPFSARGNELAYSTELRRFPAVAWAKRTTVIICLPRDARVNSALSLAPWLGHVTKSLSGEANADEKGQRFFVVVLSKSKKNTHKKRKTLEKKLLAHPSFTSKKPFSFIIENLSVRWPYIYWAAC